MQGSCAGGIARMFGGTEAAENRTLRERVRALEQQLASAAALQQQLTSKRSENVALQEQLASTRSQFADDKQTIVALQEQLMSTRSQLAGALTREQVLTGRLAFFVKMDKDEKDLAERIATLKLELAELETSTFSASQGALSTLELKSQLKRIQPTAPHRCSVTRP